MRKPNQPKYARNHALLPPGAIEKSLREKLAAEARYIGNPQHKRSPGDFGLTPAADPRPNKTRCDSQGGITSVREATQLLKLALEKGVADARNGAGDWPKHLWAVKGRTVFEGAFSGSGVYHGYPLQPSDPFAAKILKAWHTYEE